METLLNDYKALLERQDTRFVRYLHDEINWNSRLVAILGARGVGKTTLLLQHIKLHDNKDESLYVLADDFYFANHRLFDLAQQFYQQGGKRLYVDEIHKLRDWSVEIKNIYDKLPGLKVVYTGSSMLDLENGGADLSRRKLEYHLHGLSLREYINIVYGLQLKPSSLEDVLKGQVDFPMNDIRPMMQLSAYTKEGYYPYFKENDYLSRLNGVLKQVAEVDIPQFAEMESASRQKLKKLLYVLAQSVPFKPNYSKLGRDLGISRNVLPEYMHLLEKAGLISLLPEKVTGMKMLEKIEKVYLQNPNIAYALPVVNPDVGSIRESLFFAWTSVRHKVTASSVADFEVDDITFEIGGRNKTKRQIIGAETERAYVVRDDMEYAGMKSVPLWMFGFLY